VWSAAAVWLSLRLSAKEALQHEGATWRRARALFSAPDAPR
jgi:hypothetical protein